MSEKFNRRRFLQGGIAAGLSATVGCSTPPSYTESLTKSTNIPARKNVFNILKEYNFIDQDGERVDMRQLKNTLKDQFITLNSGFQSCGSYCPLIDPHLAEIGKMSQKAGKQVTSIIIDVLPEMDGLYQEERDAYTRMLKGYNIKNPLVLYLSTAEGAPLSNDMAQKQVIPELAGKFGLIVNEHPAVTDHSAEIMLFRPGGDWIDKKNGLSNSFSSWSQYFTHPPATDQTIKR